MTKIVIIVSLVILLGAGTFFYISQSSSAQQSNNTSTSSNTISTAANSSPRAVDSQQGAQNLQTPAVPQNWKTYANDNLKFSFQYPPEFEIKEDSLQKKREQSVSSQNLVLIDKTSQSEVELWINPMGFGYRSNKTYQLDYIDNVGFAIQNPMEKLSFNDEIHSKTETIIVGTSNAQKDENLRIFLSYTFPRSLPEKETQFLQIISTFQIENISENTK